MEKKYTALGVCISLLKVVLYFALWIVAQIVVVNLAAIIVSSKFPGADEYELTKMIDGLSNEINTLVGCVTILALAIFSKLTNDTLSKRASINKYPAQFTLTSVIMGVAASCVIALALTLMAQAKLLPESWVNTQNDAYSYVFLSSPFMQFISIGFMAPLMEEILFRGCILGTLRKEMHPWVAIIISAAIFGVAHGTPLGMIYATVIGIIMGWLAVTFNSIVPSLLFHMAYNCTQLYSEKITLGIAIMFVPILIFQIISIKNYFRGKKE